MLASNTATSTELSTKHGSGILRMFIHPRKQLYVDDKSMRNCGTFQVRPPTNYPSKMYALIRGKFFVKSERASKQGRKKHMELGNKRIAFLTKGLGNKQLNSRCIERRVKFSDTKARQRKILMTANAEIQSGTSSNMSAFA